jgi:hypothetical protein
VSELISVRLNFHDTLITRRSCAPDTTLSGGVNMLWTIFVILVVLWLLGFSLHIGGGLIHVLLVVGLVVLVINLLSGRRTEI